jgi:ATP-binding cassette subfamily A (ABC1) protein 3
VEGLATQEELFNYVREEEVNPYCLGIYFKTFDLENHDFEIQYSFQKFEVPESTSAPYNELVMVPDWGSWGSWTSSGVLTIESYVTEFIARSYANKKTPSDSTFSDPSSLYDQQLGFAPFSSVEYPQVSAGSIAELADGFPFYLVIIFLTPFYYLTSKIASEKESKAREGMKMMGLQDAVYYLAWFLFFAFLVIVITICCWIVARGGMLERVDLSLFFVFLMLYGLSLYGQAFVIVALFPTRKTSGVAASMGMFITYALRDTVSDPNTPAATQYLLSIFPNVCMARISKMLFFFNFNTRDGLSSATGGASYEGYSFNGGILMMVFNCVFWTLLGFYLDQVVPS